MDPLLAEKSSGGRAGLAILTWITLVYNYEYVCDHAVSIVGRRKSEEGLQEFRLADGKLVFLHIILETALFSDFLRY